MTWSGPPVAGVRVAARGWLTDCPAVANPAASKVWAALTTAEGLGTWFGDKGATIELRPGGSAPDDVDQRRHADRAGRGAEGFRLHLAHLRADRGRIRLRPVAARRLPQGVRRQHRGLGERAGRAGRLPQCRLTSRRSPNRSSSPWPAW